MQPAIDNSYGDPHKYWLGIGFVTLLKFPSASVAKYHKLGDSKQSKQNNSLIVQRD